MVWDAIVDKSGSAEFPDCGTAYISQRYISVVLVHIVGSDPFPSSEYLLAVFKSCGSVPLNLNHFSPESECFVILLVVKALKDMARITATIPKKYFFII